MAIFLIGCVIGTVTDGVKRSQNFADVIYGWSLVAGRASEALPLLHVAQPEVPPQVVAHLDHHAAQQADEGAALRLLHLILEQVVHLLDCVQL